VPRKSRKSLINSARINSPNPTNTGGVRLQDRLRFVIWVVFAGNSLEAAQAADVEPSTLHRIVEGKVHDPRLSTLGRLARAFGVPLEWLLGLGDPPAQATVGRGGDERLWLLEAFNRARQQPYRDWISGARADVSQAGRLRKALLELPPIGPELVLEREATAVLLQGADRENYQLTAARLAGDLETELLRWGVARLRELGAESSHALPPRVVRDPRKNSRSTTKR
jgi:transcriptional regulator with XRE-family HTH domain